MLQLRINKQPKFDQFYTAAEIRWSVQRWLNEKQLHCFYFHPSKQDCFELKGPCQHQGNIIKETSLNNAIKQTDCLVCQRVVGKRLSIQNNRVSIDENRRSGFYPNEPIIWSQRPYTTCHIYLFQKMEHKINKICINLYTSGKLRIWQLTRCVYFHNTTITSEIKSR